MMEEEKVPNPNLFLRYRGDDKDDDSNVSLAELGVSLAGFDAVFKEFARVLRIDIEPEVQATANREGSFIVDIAAWWKDTSAALPFHSVEDFLTFLRIAEDPMLRTAEDFFNNLSEERRTLNEWVAANPIDSAILAWLFAKVSKKLIKRAGDFKRRIDNDAKDLPRRIQLALQKVIKKKGFKKALLPMTENKASSIEVSDNRDFKDSARVDQDNLSDYLADDDMILPHLENGNSYDLNGAVTSLKATRGDLLTLQIHYEGEDYNLDALPALGLTSKHYIDFYQEDVQVYAEVIRTSLYKKPKLRIHRIQKAQLELGLIMPDGVEEQAIQIENIFE
ncbi:MAG: hypothetical protein WC657_08175 [Candidatus Paceibacterota bacterium]|jgi:hypothetical protein